MRNRLIRWIGFVVYFISFWLPAIGNPDFHQQSEMLAHSVPGWACAFFSLFWGCAGIIEIFHHSDLTGEGRRLFFSLLFPGLVNPLLLLYLGLTLKNKAIRVQKVIDVLIPILLASSAIPLMLIPFTPVVGFYIWIAGSITILLPDYFQAAAKLRARWQRTHETSSPDPFNSHGSLKKADQP